MKKIQILMLSLLTVFAFSAVATSVASATEFELLCLKDSGSTITPKFETEETCEAMTPEDPTGTWYLGFEWLVSGNSVPAGGVTVDIVTPPGGGKTLLLEDMSAGPLKQATDVICEGEAWGLLLPEGLDEVNAVPVMKCEKGSPAGACTTLDKVEPVNLPWLTELLPFKTNEALDDVFTSSGGFPGWLVECETALGKKDDTCTTNSGNTLLSAEGTEEINTEFLVTAEEPEWAECSEGNPKLNGLVVGLQIIMALVSGALVPLTIS